MKTEFQITPDDYVSAGLLNGELTRKSKVIHYAIDVMLVALSATAFYFDKFVWAGGLIGAAIGANLLPYLLRRVYTPWYLKRHYAKYKAIQKPMSILLHSDGVEFSTSDGRGLLKWDDIHHWRENDNLLLIYLAPKIYYMTPKRLKKSGFPIGDLTAKLIEHLGPAN